MGKKRRIKTGVKFTNKFNTHPVAIAKTATTDTSTEPTVEIVTKTQRKLSKKISLERLIQKPQSLLSKENQVNSSKDTRLIKKAFYHWNFVVKITT